jgi:organic hydroperoxide reductase OsmC/OhrA
MLWFLSLAADRGFIVESYEDDAVGSMGRLPNGHEAVTDVVLHPRIVFAGDRRPDAAEIATVHESAHEHCFIANSVKSAIRVEAQP